MPETITVSSLSELQSAYRSLSNDAGGTIKITGGVDEISLSGGGSAKVTITSANASKMTSLDSIRITDARNIDIENVLVESGSDWQVRVTDSSGISIRESAFVSDARGLLTPTNKSDVGHGAHLMSVNGSRDVVFEDNVATGHFHGVAAYESTDIKISGNDISQFQGDGIRMSGVQRVEVTNNHLHDYFGTQQGLNHSDMLQIFATSRTDLVTKDITISGNVFNTGEAAAQGIFIKNETVSDTGKYYQDITITDNIIFSGKANGIRVYHTDGVEIVDNTVLHNSDAKTLNSSGSVTSHTPGIRTDSVRDSTVEGNIAHNFTLNGKTSTGANAKISTGEIGQHFTGATKGDRAEIDDLQLKSSSPLVGYGAAASQPGASTDIAAQPISAPVPAAPAAPPAEIEAAAPPPQPEPEVAEELAEISLGLNEAEDLTLSGYEVQQSTNGDVSGSEVIRTDGSGSAKGQFNGPADDYILTVGWINENDGESKFSLLIDGEVVSGWTGEGGEEGSSLSEHEISLSLSGGELIELVGEMDWGEFARIDSISLTPVQATEPEPEPTSSEPETAPAVAAETTEEDDVADPESPAEPERLPEPEPEEIQAVTPISFSQSDSEDDETPDGAAEPTIAFLPDGPDGDPVPVEEAPEEVRNILQQLLDLISQLLGFDGGDDGEAPGPATLARFDESKDDDDTGETEVLLADLVPDGGQVFDETTPLADGNDDEQLFALSAA